MPVEAVVFDVDGVILRHPDPLGWIGNLERDLGVAPATLQQEFFAKHWHDVVNGRSGLRERLEPVLARLAPALSVDDLVAYWFANDAHLDEELLADISTLRSTGMQVHLGTVQEHERAAYLWQTLDLKARFDAIHYAADLGCSKPHADFYTAVERRTGLPPHALLLVDDQQRNVAGARGSGWLAELWTGQERLPQIMNRVGIDLRAR